jgi:hypothetical protein
VLHERNKNMPKGKVNSKYEDIRNIISEDLSKIIADNNVLAHKRYPLTCQGTPTALSVADYSLESRGNRLLLIPCREPICAYKGNIVFSKTKMEELELDISFGNLFEFAFDLNLYLQNKERISIRTNELKKVEVALTSTLGFDQKHNLACLDIMASIVSRNKKEKEILCKSKKILYCLFEIMEILQNLYNIWYSLMNLNFTLEFSSISKKAVLNLSYFKACGEIGIRNLELAYSKVRLIPIDEGLSYFIPLNSYILRERGISLSKSELRKILSRLITINSLEKEIKRYELSAIRKKIELIDKFGFLSPDLEPLLLFKLPMCEELVFQVHDEKAYASTRGYEYSPTEYPVTPSKEPRLLNKLVAFGCFGAAAQAMKRTVKSDSYIDSAMHGIIAGFFIDTGLGLLKGKQEQ